MDFGYLFTSFEGRIGRGDWWKGFVGLLVLQFISWVLFGDDGLIAFVASVLLLVAGIALHLKRLHDRGKSWPWLLLLLIPVVGLIWAIVDLGILEGDPGPNRYGPPPVPGESRARLT
jgi:uncharacterized membrane protein YhaH (DUF805 family)